MSFGTPLHGLGVDLGSATPGQLNVPTPLLQSVGMATTMSEIMHGVGKRNEDEERRLKMRSVLNTIGKRKGRSCEESIARVARRVGLTNDIDDYRYEDKTVGNRMITMAGSAKVLIDVDLKQHAATDVRVTLMGSEALMAQQEAASKVLLQDLTPPNGVLLSAHLDRFAANLSKLATLDKLSSDTYGGVDCFEAITGVYTSLRKLYELEKDAVKALRKFSVPEADHRAEHEVLCKRSGKPTVHENGKIGLSIAYWTTDPPASEQGDTAMDVDGQEHVDSQPENRPTTWSLDIEIEKSPAGMYPSVRLSDAWLPEFFELPAPESGEGIPWQEPPTTFASDPVGDKNDTINIGGQRLPDLRFVAKFDPPLVVPIPTAVNILNLVGAQQLENGMYPHYHLAVFNVPPHKQTQPLTIRADKKVLALQGSEEVELTHRYNLDVSQIQYSWTLERLPFSHPRQLIELLPTLRQWASTSSLLRTTFGDNDPTIITDIDAAATSITDTHLNDPTPSPDSAIDLDDLMTDTAPSPADLQIDLAFATAPNPTFSVASSDLHRGTVSHVVAQILPNADIVVSDFDDDDDDDVKDVDAMDVFVPDQTSDHAKKLATALQLCAADLGVWVEWMRRLGG